MDAMTYDAKLRARAETLATTCIHGGDGAVPYGATDVPVVLASAFALMTRRPPPRRFKERTTRGFTDVGETPR